LDIGRDTIVSLEVNGIVCPLDLHPGHHLDLIVIRIEVLDHGNTLMARPIFTVVLTIVSVFTATSMILTNSNVAPQVSARSISSSLPTGQVKVTREISAPIDQMEYCF
jgi:hypothetical protein